jgi:hypothetical protein
VSRRRPADGIRGPPGSERADPSCSAVSAMVPAVSGRSTCFRRTSSDTPDRRRHADPPVNPGSGLNGGRLRRHRSVTPSCRSGSGALAAIVRRRVFRMAPRSAPRELTRRPGRTFLEPYVPGAVRRWPSLPAVRPGRPCCASRVLTLLTRAVVVASRWSRGVDGRVIWGAGSRDARPGVPRGSYASGGRCRIFPSAPSVKGEVRRAPTLLAGPGGRGERSWAGRRGVMPRARVGAPGCHGHGSMSWWRHGRCTRRQNVFGS